MLVKKGWLYTLSFHTEQGDMTLALIKKGASQVGDYAMQWDCSKADMAAHYASVPCCGLERS